MKKILYGLIWLTFVYFIDYPAQAVIFIDYPAQAAITWSMYDQFDGSVIDTSKWILKPEGSGSILPYLDLQNERLVLEAADPVSEADSEIHLASPSLYTGIMCNLHLADYARHSDNSGCFEAGMGIQVDFGNEYAATFELYADNTGSLVGTAFIEYQEDDAQSPLPEYIIDADWGLDHSVGIAIDGNNIFFFLDGSVVWTCDAEIYNPAFADARIEIITNGGDVTGYVDNIQLASTVPLPLDHDGDIDGYTENQGDCDDNDSTIYPGATEICGDGIDQDCNGEDWVCPLDTEVAQIENFVTGFYEKSLLRSPDQTGLTHWVNALESGEITAKELSEGFLLSPEFTNLNTTDQEFITTLYQVFMGREPDAGGLVHWLNAINDGMSRSNLLDKFASSIEFENICSEYGINAVAEESLVEQFVIRFYEKCLNRVPDQEGLNNWVTGLENSSLTGADLAESFIFSQEFYNIGTSDEEFLLILYQAFFNSQPDTNGYNHWVNALNDGTSRANVLDGFTGSVEFETLCGEYNITPNTQ